MQQPDKQNPPTLPKLRNIILITTPINQELNSSKSESLHSIYSSAYANLIKINSPSSPSTDQNFQDDEPYQQQPQTNKSKKKKKQPFYQDDFSSNFGTNYQYQWKFSTINEKEFQKAFNQFIRYGSEKPKYKKFKPFMFADVIFGTDIDFDFSFQKQHKNYKNQHNSRKKQQYEQENTNYKNRQNNKKLDIHHPLKIIQQQLGTTVTITLQKQINCPKCISQRSQNYSRIPCKTCQKHENTNTTTRCHVCKGKGYINKYQCRTCQNQGFILKKFNQAIIIPLTCKNGQQFVLTGRGHQHRTKGHFGKLIITIRLPDQNQQNHQQTPFFEIPITRLQARQGSTATVKLGKSTIQVKIPPGVQHGEIIETQAQNQVIKLKINIISSKPINEEEKNCFRKFKKIRNN